MSEMTRGGRYVTRAPRALWDDVLREHDGYERKQPSLTVHEDENNQTRETGLLDALGNPLVFVPERLPMGFRK